MVLRPVNGYVMTDKAWKTQEAARLAEEKRLKDLKADPR
jgi:hypothetical protein